MNMAALNRTLLNQLTEPHERLEGIERWLLDDVWSTGAFQSAGQSPKDYLLRGEAQVNVRENLLTAAGTSITNELASGLQVERSIPYFFQENPKSAVVIFDGCSLREFPRLMQLAKDSHREILEIACGRAAIPSETECFVADRLGFGLPSIGPSQLTGRGEFKKEKIRFYYFKQANDHHTIQDDDESLLLWSRFPDQRYTDSTAVSEVMFEGLWDGFEQAWLRTVQAVPPDRKILVTSDHGYIFLGSGLSDPNLKNVDRCLNGKRFRFFQEKETLPNKTAGLWVDSSKRLAVLAGRGHNRPQAPSASQSIYRHGGLTLMEMLTPWLVLGPVQ